MNCEKADMILYNARVLTCDEQNPVTAFVAIKGNAIIGTADNADADCFLGPNTKRVDCQGMTIVPGFNDAHCHPISYAIIKTQVDCSPATVKSIGDIKSLIREKARFCTRDGWVRGALYNETHLAEKRHPNRHDLDEASPDHPVMLVHYTGGICILNSLALKIVGITRETASASGGKLGIEQETSTPNGQIFGMNERVQKNVPSLSQNELMEGFRLAGVDYISNGITSLQDTGWNNNIRHWNYYQDFKSMEGILPSRVSMLFGIGALEEALRNGLMMGYGNSSLRIGGVKIALDESTGYEEPPQEDLNRVTMKVAQAGYIPAFHVSNLYQMRSSIVAIKRALRETKLNVKRYRLEHCLLCTPDILSPLMEVHPIIVTQPSILYYQGHDFMESIPYDSRDCIMPLVSFKNNGLSVALSSDSPLMPVSPLLGIYEAVSRKELYGNIIALGEAVTPREALKMYTLMGAYASGEEHIKGSIIPGKLADLILLNNDPTQITTDEIKDISVMMTIIDGKIVWER